MVDFTLTEIEKTINCLNGLGEKEIAEKFQSRLNKLIFEDQDGIDNLIGINLISVYDNLVLKRFDLSSEIPL